ncbi:MAG: UDP-N-acetylmuramoyl-L-alanyl-D-glutamate--2,6-diaminopimelate ligase [Nocardioides sp.]
MTTGGDRVRPRRSPRVTLTGLLGHLASSGAEPALSGGADVVGFGDPIIRGVSLNTHRVEPGDLYAALPGTRSHGAAHARAARSAGATAVLTDRAGAGLLSAGAGVDGADLPVIVVDSPRRVLGELSAWIYGHPAKSLRMIAVTGTQGKTTVTRMAEGALTHQGVPAAVVGTVGTRIRGRELGTALTTPEAPDLQALLALMVEDGVEICAMEASSHALVLGRIDAITFDVAGFTNLGRDHLDFHQDMEEYFLAKAALFEPARARRGVVNLDDPYGRRLAANGTIPLAGFSTASAASTLPLWSLRGSRPGAKGSQATVGLPDGRTIPLEVPVPGDFNIANAIAAMALCAEAGYPPELFAAGLAAGGGVPGRMEWIQVGHSDHAGQDFSVVVDYAHKPGALRAALASLRPLTKGRLIVVFGAGGDRDAGKRPLMGAVAAELADLVIVTDDNPRSESAGVIRTQITTGIPAGTDVVEIGDRRAAIAAALTAAGPGDTVLIAGKGHESGQEAGGVVSPFDDRQVAREVLDR